MDIEKLTHKSQEALNSANEAAVEMNHQELTPLHLMLALVRQPEGFIGTLIESMGIKPDIVESAILERLKRIPAVTGNADLQTYMSRSMTAVLSEATKVSARMKDEFVSVEHLFIACIEKDKECAQAASIAGITSAKILESLKKNRGNQRVTSQAPEETFQALQKYGRNLSDMAKQGKLDPVIGRDEEIRRVVQILSRRTKNNPVLIG
ncbi:MAG TPA: type VI secretion system ATPase TssH, partial [Fibrobacteres bacterium]|nr:type VI secretion system ATPase TssH [Fibrobacterota bacterium]